MNELRYREAENRLWDEAGVDPIEHRLHLARNDVEVRLQEAGAGPPVLFIHGGPGTTGAVFASLVARLPQLRCLLLDRPGTGLSDSHPLAGPAEVRRECETLVIDVLDALGIERAHLVGSSHGSYVALLSAAAHDDRVGRTVHLGCPGFAEGMTVTGFDRLVLLPGARHVFGLLPTSERSLSSTLRQLGHDATVNESKFSSVFIDWSVATLRHTDTMRNELQTMASMGSFRRGFDPALTIEPDLLARVGSPTYFLWGDNDPYGDEAVGQRMVELMPCAQLEIMPGAGHLCWFDGIEHTAQVIQSHMLELTAERGSTASAAAHSARAAAASPSTS